MRHAADFGWALALAALLVLFLGAADDGPVAAERDVPALEARAADLLARYDGAVAGPPTVEIADWSGPGVASASCDRWRIRVRPAAVETLSDDALDELLAHELAHLLVCAETGRRAAHDTEWWRAYRQIVTG